jgi:hypothetical protein
MMRQQTYDEYDTAWRAVIDSINALTSQKEENLARVLNLLAKPPEPNPNADLLDRYGYRFCGRRLTGIPNYYYEAPLFDLLLQQELCRAVDSDTRNILELGSGYGRNLFRLWLNGGPSDAAYVGAEFTAGGRECASLLATLERRIKFSSVPFDYYQPSVMGFDKNEKTFVFTCYSIEQIPTISDRVFEILLSMPGLYRAVHFEPVGWQRRAQRPLPFTDESRLLAATKMSARELKYNTNLLETLDRLEAERKIVIETIKYEFLAHRPNLPGTLIVWRPYR